MVDVYLQARRDGEVVKRFFVRLVRRNGGEPREMVTDKPGSYGVAHQELMPETIHERSQYANTQAERSHEAIKVRERILQHFISAIQARHSYLLI